MGKHYYGLDIGIGSVGWAVLDVNDDNARILDFGVRLFSSGEDTGKSETKNQQRRTFRTTRRVLRRKKHRCQRLKNYLNSILVLTPEDVSDWYTKNNLNIFNLRSEGLDNKLTPTELAVCLIHISNHRGYKEFYDEHNDTKEIKETEKIKNAIKNTSSQFESSKYRTIGEMIAKDNAFCNQNSKNSSLPLCRNHHGKYSYMFLRKDIENETKLILKKQQHFYTELSNECIDKIIDIIFRQRYFEYGPGNPNDDKRRYKGFLHRDVIGNCAVYKDELRGARHTVIGDLFAIVNALSQYQYYNCETGDEADFGIIVKLVIEYVLDECHINKTKLRKLLKNNGIEAIISDNAQDIGKCIRYLESIREMIEQAGLDWTSFISEPQLVLNPPSRLHQLGQCLSSYITPSLRRDKLNEFDFINDTFIKNCTREKFSGTANVSNRFMLEAILEALKGTKYGDFQARINGQKEFKEKKKKHLPPITDKDIITNPVVFRAVNETRKIINALISKYEQQPAVINIEVADDLGRSEKSRKEISSMQKKNAKIKENAVAKINELFQITKPKHSQIDRYLLYEMQGGKCMYSNNTIELDRLFSDDYEIDHIIPYSLILDDSLNNKALVTTNENRNKGQRAPLEYLQETKRTEFIKRTNFAFNKKKISKKKYAYLMLKTLKNEKVLSEWKSRNINDTRYITKYIANYLQENLCFDSSRKKTVHRINGRVTSRFRQIWLKGSPWGKKEKDRSETQLHHAIDAIVVANLTPAYIELASDYLKLRAMRREYAGHEFPDEYYQYLEKSCKKMKEYYHYNEDYTQNLLEGGKIPTIVPHLIDEVTLRFDSPDINTLLENAKEYYLNDKFANKLRLPMVSRKPEKKFRGSVVASENPVSLKHINGQTYQFKGVKLETITSKQVDNIVGISQSAKTQMHNIYKGQPDKYTLGDYLKEHDIEFLKRKDGNLPKRLTIAIKEDKQMYEKTIQGDYKSKTDTQIWDTKSYYCLEVYKDIMDKTRVRGIRYTDLKRKAGRLYLTSQYPEDYCRHILYLFKNDYIVVYDNKGNEKKRGFYQAIKSIPSASVRIIRDNCVQAEVLAFAQSCEVKKFNISLLGEIGGEIKCGEPYSLLKADG